MTSLTRIIVLAYVFEWKVDAPLDLATGAAIKSAPFSAGTDNESTWQMIFYPARYFGKTTDDVALSLKMTYGSPVKASSRILLTNPNKIIKEHILPESIYNDTCTNYIYNFASVMDISYPLLIRCELKISEEKGTLPYSKRANDVNRLLTDIYSLHSQQKEKDLLIITGDQVEFRAHKIVLAARSDVFLAMFQCNRSENVELKLEIPDMAGSDVEEMLEYIYSGKITKWSLRLCMSLYAAGEKYQINALRDTCSLYIQQNINFQVSAYVLILADKHGDKILKEVALQFISKHAREVLKTRGWKTIVEKEQHLVDELILYGL